MIVVASQPITITRDQTNTSGLPAANTHTAKLWKNGVETAEVVTPASTPTTGVYSFAFTIPGNAAQYDVWSLRVVDGDGYAATVWEGVTGGSGGGSGPGADLVTITIQDDGTPEANVSVWITTDAAGVDVTAGALLTNSSGQRTFLLTAGTTYYLWAHKTGKIDIQGQAFVAVAD